MENNLDKLFKSKLGGQDPDFDPAAWDRMEGILDAAGMTPAPKKKSKRNRFFYLFLLFIGILGSTIGYISIIPSNTNGEGSTIVDNTIEAKNNNSTQSKSIHSNLLSNSSSNTSKPLIKKSNRDQKVKNKTVQTNSGEKALSKNETDSNKGLNKNKSTKLEEKETKYRDAEINRIFKNTHTKTQSEYLEDKINNQVSNAEVIAATQLKSQNSLDNVEKANDITEYPDAEKNAKSLIDRSAITGADFTENEIAEASAKELLTILDFLKTRPGVLNSAPILVSPPTIVTPKNQMTESSIFTIGVMASARFSEGLGYSVGPYVSYNIGNGFAVNLGGQFDAQAYDAGPQMTVIDKVYSFGSKLSERKFSLTNQKSLRIPLTISKSFNGFSLSTGAIVNKVFASEGSISKSSDGSILENAIVDSDMINPMTLSLQLGASVDISRYFELYFGVEYRPKAFADDLSTSNNTNKYYPTVGLRYKLFKF